MNNAVRKHGIMDVHTHILPGMDDGSASLKESVEMIRASVGQGIGSIVMTPHFYPRRESPERFLERREKSVRALIGAVKDLDGMPEMYFGAEVEYFEGMARSPDMEDLLIGRSRVLLVEMPFCRWSDRMVSELMFLREARSITPLLAHVERYLSYQPPDMIEDLVGRGVLIQSNASFFMGTLRSRQAMRMLRNRQIHLLGSDCHNMHSRPPNLGAAIERIRAKGEPGDIAHIRRMQKILTGRCPE
ncbi:MAG: hypothetical protein E7337_04695 [Clostridiales bacterium]|nr:hypothetical protein [Clostridiales bacterium]